MLTLLRLVLTGFLSYYLLNNFGAMVFPLLIFLLIFLTDYFDGKIARLYGLATPGGAIFDLLADLFFMLLSHLVLIALRLIPSWFLFVIIFKFIEFVVTSFFLSRSDDGKGIFVFDFLGRLVSVAFYLFPALLYVSYWYSPGVYAFCISRLCYIILFLAFLSSFYRVWRCFHGNKHCLKGF